MRRWSCSVLERADGPTVGVQQDQNRTLHFKFVAGLTRSIHNTRDIAATVRRGTILSSRLA